MNFSPSADHFGSKSLLIFQVHLLRRQGASGIQIRPILDMKLELLFLIKEKMATIDSNDMY
jgi:hypothetical protein